MGKKILLFLLFVPLLFGCLSENASENYACSYGECNVDGGITNATTNRSGAVTQNETAGDNITVEVYHFHGTNQCYSCIRVGELAEKTVNTYFKDEVKSEKVIFGHINWELPENKDLVKKYGATGSSIWIGTYKNGEFHKEQNMNVWYKINNEDDYLKYLKEVMEKRLSGELN
ncbi:MAG: nitrophenyl compound nitroreductase subunit ArsF family protein [Candidatus Micrarchaeota archaeon]